MKKTLLAVLVAVVVGAVPVQAGDAFSHHIDLFQAGITKDKVVLSDVGYHFTVFRIAKRVELFGAGVMLDGGWKNMVGDMKVNFLLTAPVLDIALADPDKANRGDPWVSFSFKYGYDFTDRDHVFLAGFCVSLH